MSGFLENLITLLPIILSVLFLFKYKHNKHNIVYKLFCFYLMFIAVVQIIYGVMFHYKINNLLLSHVYFIGESLLLVLFFRELIKTHQKRKIDFLIIIVFVCLIILIILDRLGYYVLNPFDPLEIILCALPVFCLSVMHLYNSLSESLKFLYVTIGVIVYKTISVLVFILQNFTNTIDYFDDLSFILWKLNSIFLLIYYGLIFFEWFKNFRQKRIS